MRQTNPSSRFAPSGRAPHRALRNRRLSPRLGAGLFLLVGAVTSLTAATARRADAGSPASEAASTPAALVGRAHDVLNAALREEQGFVWIHALEAAVDLGRRHEARQLLQARLPEVERSASRTGAWRVLARIAPDDEAQASWRASIEAAFLEPHAPDRLQAIESLAKLGQVRSPAVIAAARTWRSELPEPDAVFPLWALVVAGDSGALTQLVGSLESPDPILRRRAAYVLRWIRPSAEWVRRSLRRAVDAEPAGTLPHAYLLCAAITLELDPAQTTRWAAMLEQQLPDASPGLVLEAAQALRHVLGPAEIVRLAPWLGHAHGDARIGAAWALLHVLERR